MARYQAQLTSSAAITSGTAFAWLGYSSSVSFRLRRVQLGIIAGSGAVTAQQLQVGINNTSSGSAATPVNVTNSPMQWTFASSSNNLISSWATPPTLASVDTVSLAFNSQSGGDWPWEIPEDFWPSHAPATNSGFAFVNRVNTVPTGASYVITCEWEE